MCRMPGLVTGSYTRNIQPVVTVIVTLVAAVIEGRIDV